MAEYILHDGIEDDYNNHHEELRFAITSGGIGGGGGGIGMHTSPLMLATDEIPLISVSKINKPLV